MCPLLAPESPLIVCSLSDTLRECPNVAKTRNGMPATAWKKYVNFASKNLPPSVYSGTFLFSGLLIILLIPQKSSMLIATVPFCHRSFDSTTRSIPPSNEILAVSATISLLTPSEQNPCRQASVRGYLNPVSVRCSTHSV